MADLDPKGGNGLGVSPRTFLKNSIHPQVEPVIILWFQPFVNTEAMHQK